MAATTPTEALYAESDADLATAAYTIYKRYRKHVDYRTLYAVVSDHYDTHPELAELSPKELQRELRKAAEVVARKRKAAKSGYHIDDEYFYSQTVIRKLLPYATDPQATPPATLADEMTINRKHAGKAEGYGGWEAAIADIRKALQRVGNSVRRIQRFLGGANPHGQVG